MFSLAWFGAIWCARARVAHKQLRGSAAGRIACQLGLGGELVLVEQAAEPIATAEADRAGSVRRRGGRRLEAPGRAAAADAAIDRAVGAETQPSSPRASSRRARSPPRRRIVQTVLAAIWTPRPTNFALDPPVSPTRVRACEPHHQLPDLAHRHQARRRRCGYVQRHATSSRRQRRSLAGVTKKDVNARRCRTRPNAASSARPASVNTGRAT
jgi:hypothetical protein